jgi:ATP-binding cassette, subfamily B (MDR/TAP), member 1
MTPLGCHKNGKSSKRETMLDHRPRTGTSKNTGASYFALFRPLHDVQSRLVLSCGVVLAVAAGAPLPIIGVIFARIIDAFPPTEDEVHQRISQLLGVGKLSLQCSVLSLTLEATAYFAVTWGWASCWGIVGSRISRGLRIAMVDRALGMDLTYYETECPDVTCP